MLEQEKAQEAHMQKVEASAKAFMEELNLKYHITTGMGTGQSCSEHMQAAVDGLTRVQHSRQSELSAAKEARQALGTTQGARVQQMRLEIDQIGKTASGKEHEASTLEVKLRTLQERLADSGCAGDEATLALSRQEVKDLKTQVAELEEDFNGSGLNEDIAVDKARKRALKDSLVRLQEELTSIERESGKAQRLQHAQSLAQDRKLKLEATISERRPKLHGVMDVPHAEDVMRMLEQDSLQRELTRRKVMREEEVLLKEREAGHASEKFQRKNSEVYLKQEALRNIEQQIHDDEGEVRKTDELMLQENYDFDGKLQALEQRQKEAETEKAEGAGLRYVFERAVAKLGTEHKCIVCTQTTDASSEAKIRNKLETLKRKTEANGAERSEVDMQVDAAIEATRKHKHAMETWKVLKRRKTSEQPAMSANLERLKAESAQLKKAHEDCLAEVVELKERAKVASDLASDVAHLKYLHDEYQKAQAEVGSVQSGMQSGMSSCHRPKEVVISEKDEAQTELDNLERRIELATSELERKRSELQEARGRCSRRELDLNKLQANLERRSELESQVAEQRTKIVGLRAEAARIRESERPQQQALAAAEQQLRKEEQRLDHSVRDWDAKVAELLKDHTKLTDFATRLAESASASRRQLVADREARVQEAERVVAKRRTEHRETSAKRMKGQENVQMQEKLKLQMHANLAFRELRRKERVLHEAMSKVKAEISELEPAAEEAAKELSRLNKTIQSNEMDCAKMEGSLSTVQMTVKTLSQQLKDPQYKQIDSKHREKLIEHKTVQMAVDDLNSYFKALNAALVSPRPTLPARPYITT